jgi:hypothetical protein
MTSGDDNRTDPDRVVPTTEARQAVTGHNVRYVLFAGTAGVVVLFAIIYVIYFA